MTIAELGHTGLWVNDLPLMLDFYQRVIGLTLVDHDEEIGMAFLCSRPDTEHHELVLQTGRDVPPGGKQLHQISWRVESLDDLRAFHRKFREEGVRVQQEVTHGNAFGIYFFDPEGNRNEVYLRVDQEAPQPFRKTIDFGLPPEEIYAEAERLLNEGGPTYRPVL